MVKTRATDYGDHDPHKDSGRETKRRKKGNNEVNPIERLYDTGYINPGSSNIKEGNAIEAARRASQKAIETVFNEPAASDKPVKPENKDQQDISDIEIDVKFIKIEYIQRAKKDLVSKQEEKDEILANLSEKGQQYQEDRHRTEALGIMNELENKLASPGDLQSYWNSISGKGRSNTLGFSGADNPYLKEAIHAIKTAVLKEQNAEVTAQGTPEPTERETSPTPEPGPSQPQGPSFVISDYS